MTRGNRLHRRVPISEKQNTAASAVSREVTDVLHRWVIDFRKSNRTTPGQATYQPDSSFRPHRSVIGAQPPANLDRNVWVTVIVEILRSQTWSSIHRKIDVYRVRPGVQYIICIRMSQLLVTGRTSSTTSVTETTRPTLRSVTRLRGTGFILPR